MQSLFLYLCVYEAGEGVEDGINFLVKVQSSEFFSKVIRNNCSTDPILVEDGIKVTLLMLLSCPVFLALSIFNNLVLATTRRRKDLETSFMVLWLY